MRLPAPRDKGMGPVSVIQGEKNLRRVFNERIAEHADHLSRHQPDTNGVCKRCGRPWTCEAFDEYSESLAYWKLMLNDLDRPKVTQ